MNARSWAVVGALVMAVSAGLESQQGVQSTSLPSPAGREPAWAFPVQAGTLPAEAPGPKTVPGSTKQYTPQQIDDLLNPPDWFPDEHKPGPGIVVEGPWRRAGLRLVPPDVRARPPGIGGSDRLHRRLHRPADAGLQDRRAARLRAHERHLEGSLGPGVTRGRGVVRVAAASAMVARGGSRDGAAHLRRSGPHAVRGPQGRDGADRQPHHHAARGSGSRAAARSEVRLRVLRAARQPGEGQGAGRDRRRRQDHRLRHLPRRWR